MQMWKKKKAVYSDAMKRQVDRKWVIPDEESQDFLSYCLEARTFASIPFAIWHT